MVLLLLLLLLLRCMISRGMWANYVLNVIGLPPKSSSREEHKLWWWRAVSGS